MVINDQPLRQSNGTKRYSSTQNLIKLQGYKCLYSISKVIITQRVYIYYPVYEIIEILKETTILSIDLLLTYR